VSQEYNYPEDEEDDAPTPRPTGKQREQQEKGGEGGEGGAGGAGVEGGNITIAELMATSPQALPKAHP
jgi:hypothetical protein